MLWILTKIIKAAWFHQWAKQEYKADCKKPCVDVLGEHDPGHTNQSSSFLQPDKIKL